MLLFLVFIKFVSDSSVHYQPNDGNQQEKKPEYAVENLIVGPSEALNNVINPEYNEYSKTYLGYKSHNVFETHIVAFPTINPNCKRMECLL